MNPIDLVERYLQAIAFWLPASQKQDIIAELSADIYAQVEEREATAGRTLTTAEIEDLLKQSGAPILVANRYLPQRSLIGPLLFPIYLFVLKIVGFFYIAAWAVVMISIAVFTPQGYEASGAEQFKSFLMHGVFIPIAIITLAFAILEATQKKTRFLEKWNPNELPPVVLPNQIKRSNSVAEIVVSLVFAWWWFTSFMPYASLKIFHLTIALSSNWGYFFWAYLLLALANGALAAANLKWPYWTRLRASGRLVSDIIGSVLFCWLVKANIITSLASPDLSLQRAAELTAAINMWSAKMLPVAIIVSVIVTAINIARVYRAGKTPVPLGPGLTASNSTQPHP
jgi:hypothetical protein